MATVRGSTGVGRQAVQALGDKVTASVTSQIKGFGRGIMGAAMSEMPGIQAASGYFSQMQSTLGSFGGRPGSGSGTTANVSPVAAMVKEQKTANIINLQTVRELRGLRGDTAAQTRITQQMSRDLSKGLADVNKTMREVKEKIEEGGGGGDGPGVLSSIGDGLKSIGTALAVGAGALFVQRGINQLNAPIPLNRRAQGIYARRVGGNVQRRLTPLGPPKTSTITTLYGRSPNERGGGGAAIRERFGAVSVADTEQLKATRVQTDVTRKGLRELAAGIEKVGRNTGYRGVREIQERRARDTRVKKTPEQEIIEKAQAKFLRDLNKANAQVFQKTLSDIIGDDWKKNVTQRTASGRDYLGRTISQETGFRKGMERTFEKLLGKEFGGQYGGIFADLGESYIQAGAQYLGKSFFAGTLGSDEKARVLSGQIVGNLAKGNKQVAMEQILYGFTGQASGVETVMAKYGFTDVGQGIQYTGNVLAAGTTAAVKNMTGFEGEYITIRNPATGETSVVRSMGGIVDLPVGPLPQPVVASTSSSISQVPYTPMYSSQYNPGNFIEMPYDEKGTRANVATTLGRDDKKILQDQLDANYELIETTTDGLRAATAAGLSTTNVAGEGFKANINATGVATSAQLQAGAQNTQQIVNALYETRSVSGGGTTIGVAPSSFGTFGNFLMDMGTAIVANKLTSGIKNPYLRAAANYGVTTAGGSVLKTFMGGGGDYLGNINTALFGTGGFSGFTSGITSGFSNLFGLGGGTAAVASTTSAAPIYTGVGVPAAGYAGGVPIGAAEVAGGMATTGATGGAGLTNAIGQTADEALAASSGVYGTTGQAVSSTNTAAASSGGMGTLTAIGGTLAAISAFNQFKSGDPVGGMGSALIAAGTFTANPVMIGIGVALNVVSAVFGIGRKKPPPPPNHTVHRAMMIEGNNNLAAKETIYFNTGSSKTAGPDAGVLAICDEYLTIAFNTIKTFEIRGIKTSPPIMWIQHAARQRQDGKDGNMWLAIYTTEFDSSNPTDTSKAALVIHFGQPQHASGKDASKIVEELAKFYEQNSASAKMDIDKALKDIRSSAYFEIAFNKAKGLGELENVEKGLFAEGVDESRIIADYKLKEAGIKENVKGKYDFGSPFSTKGKSSEMFKSELVGTGRYEPGDEGSMGPEIMTPSGKVYAWNPLTNKYDILVQDPTTGLQISSTGQLVQATEVKEGLAGAIALLTDEELVSIAGPYARNGAAWLRRFYGSWLESDYGARTGIDLLNDMIKAKGYDSNLTITSNRQDDEGGVSYTYGSSGRIYKYAPGVTTAAEGTVVAFDPIKNQAIFDVNGNQQFDISDVERYYEMNPIPTGTELGNLAPAVSIAPSSTDNSTTVNNYGMGTTNAQDPFRNQRSNTRPSLLSVAA